MRKRHKHAIKSNALRQIARARAPFLTEKVEKPTDRTPTRAYFPRPRATDVDNLSFYLSSRADLESILTPAPAEILPPRAIFAHLRPVFAHLRAEKPDKILIFPLKITQRRANQ